MVSCDEFGEKVDEGFSVVTRTHSSGMSTPHGDFKSEVMLAAAKDAYKRGGVSGLRELIAGFREDVNRLCHADVFAATVLNCQGTLPDIMSNTGLDDKCFYRACRLLGTVVPVTTKRVADLSQSDIDALAAVKNRKVFVVAYDLDDSRNHLEIVDAAAKTTYLEATFLATSRSPVIVSCTTAEHFFNKSNRWATYAFYADQKDSDTKSAPQVSSAATARRDVNTGSTNVPEASRFGSAQASVLNSSAQPGFGVTSSTNTLPERTAMPIAPPSVRDESEGPGGSNVTGGVVRAARRVIRSKKGPVTAGVSKNYVASNTIQFNNLDEVFQDSISREYAQEILEALFEEWGVPMDQPAATKYAEDLVVSFLIGTTASNKADWSRQYEIPVEPVERHGVTVSELTASMTIFSTLLESKFGVSRRQFARGIADDQRKFLKDEENVFILPKLASRVGCEPMLAHLAFDGSTHCSGMTSRELTFTKTLESRALFERDDVIAEGASDRLMQGFSGGVRSKVAR